MDQSALERLFCDAFGYESVTVEQESALREATELLQYPQEVVVAALILGERRKPREPETPPEAAEVEPVSPAPEEPTPVQIPDETPISESPIPESLWELLLSGGLSTVGDVRNHPDLTDLEGIGKVSAQKILAAV